MKIQSLEDCFCGAATVGERGQVVIPAEARKRMEIQPGDKMFVMIHPSGNALVLLKIEEVREMLTTMLDGLVQFEQEIKAAPNNEVQGLE